MTRPDWLPAVCEHYGWDPESWERDPVLECWTRWGESCDGEATISVYDGGWAQLECGSPTLMDDVRDDVLTTLRALEAAGAALEAVHAASGEVEQQQEVNRLRTENERLQHHLDRVLEALGERVVEVADLRARLDMRRKPNLLEQLRSEAGLLAGMIDIDTLPDGLTLQSASARLAEVRRQLAELEP